MPSTKNPSVIVNPGAGKLPSATVTASSLTFVPSGGGGGASLAAHISDPVDAHMASAIGIHPTYPATGLPMLSRVGGVIDGESVEDFLYQFKDLIPVRPNGIGFNSALGINSGIPAWGSLATSSAATGGWADGVSTKFSHFVVASGVANFSLTGMVFPSDRGVLAFYSNTDGNFLNPAATTLIAALWLGANPAPVGIPEANFNEVLRPGQQPDYVATGVNPLDQLSLTWRLPYLSSYAGYPGAPYSVYKQDFPSYQLAHYSLAPISLALGNAGSYLVVHWKETYATTLASIQPANLTLAHLTSSNCYSAVPSAPASFDDNTADVFAVNRLRVFRDASSAVAPSASVVAADGNVPPFQQYSGVTFVNADTFQVSATVTATNLFNNSFQTGSVDNPPNIPAQFHSNLNPVVLDFSEFGGGIQRVAYYDMRKQGVPGNYSPANAPQTADIGEYIGAALSIPVPTANFTPTSATGTSQLHCTANKLFTASAVATGSKKFLYNTFPASGGVAGSSTSTFEGFVDEHYRYLTAHVPASTDSVLPAGGNVYVSSQSLIADTSSLQIVGNCLAYPSVNYAEQIGLVFTYFPVGPDYSTLPGTDGVNHLRRFVRVFNTGLPRNTGTLRLRFLAGHGSASSFATDAAYTGVETAGHITGGMIVQVKVPGVTGWLDLGRPYGDPGLTTTDFYGCSTGVVTSGSDVFVTYNTTAFTANNSAGEFPLYVRVSMLNSAAGRNLRLDELEWSV